MNTPFDLTGRVAIVTGASRGLGQSFARALARAGADLVITSRSRRVAGRVRAGDRVARPQGRAARARRSQTRPASARWPTRRRTAFGGIDILVNNAGCNVRKRAADVTWDDWNLVLDTNLRGTFFASQAVARHMIPRQRGRIINIGSVTSVFGYAGLGPYGASRGGIRQLTMSLADDWGPHGITVNCLAPGWFRTDQNKVLYDDQEWVAYLVDRIPLQTPGPSGGSRGRRGVPRLGRERVHHGSDVTGRRRDQHGIDTGAAGRARMINARREVLIAANARFTMRQKHRGSPSSQRADECRDSILRRRFDEHRQTRSVDRPYGRRVGKRRSDTRERTGPTHCAGVCTYRTASAMRGPDEAQRLTHAYLGTLA